MLHAVSYTISIYRVDGMQVLAALTDGRTPEPEQYDCVTVIFCDIMDFNVLSATLQPQQVQTAVICHLQSAVVAELQ
jgi:class 3 adenylate cyclase